MPPTKAKDAPLTRAIKVADEALLRDTLLAMCDASDACAEQASKRLLVPKREADLGQQDGSDDEDAGPAAKKRKTSQPTQAEELVVRYERCHDCHGMFDVTKNFDGACRTHEGQLEIDADYFPDDDEIQYYPGEIDVETDWRREEFGEGFVWNCCNATLADGTTCVNGKHVALKS